MPLDNEIVSYLEMCQRESMSLQRGMNFNSVSRGYSVILMSARANAPYHDVFQDDGTTLIYEGHDAPRSETIIDPKGVDQPEFMPSGAATQNAKFYEVAVRFKRGLGPAHAVKVYEKIKQGIWSYNGLFQLVDAWIEQGSRRKVFKFRLTAIEGEVKSAGILPNEHPKRRRLIPTFVKLEVWKRDNGHCVLCGATDELHFDHVLPFSKGGTSITAANVQLLCARHNLSKGAKLL